MLYDASENPSTLIPQTSTRRGIKMGALFMSIFLLVGAIISSQLVKKKTNPNVEANDPEVQLLLISSIENSIATVKVYAHPTLLPIVFGSIELVFNPAEIQMTAEPIINPIFNTLIDVMPYTQSNFIGRSIVAAAVGPDSSAISNAVEIATYTFANTGTGTGQSEISIDISSPDSLFSSEDAKAFVLKSTPVSVSFVQTTNVPTLIPTAIPISVTSCDSYCVSRGFRSGTCRQNAKQCQNNRESYQSGGNTFCTSAKNQSSCCCL